MTFNLWMPFMYFVIVPAIVLFPKKETSIVTHKDLSILKTSKNCRKENIWNWYKWIQMRRSNRTGTAVVTLIQEPQHGDYDCKSEKNVWESMRKWLASRKIDTKNLKDMSFSQFSTMWKCPVSAFTKSLYPPGNEETYPTRRKRIIDTKVPAGRGYVSSLEGNKTFSSRIAKLCSRQHETMRQSPLLRNHSNTSARMPA